MIRYFFFGTIILGSQGIANPTGPSSQQGLVTFEGLGTSSVTVNSIDPVVTINWDSFSIGSNEQVIFKSSVQSPQFYVMNKVTGITSSTISGLLQSESSGPIGNIFLVNPNGIAITSTGKVMTGAFLASTLQLTNLPFDPTSNMIFQGPSINTVSNSGKIYTLAGDVTLIGYRVDNSGLISSSGTTSLGAGVSFILKPGETDRIFIQTPAAIGSDGTGVSAGGTIDACNLIIKADGNPYALAINTTGTINNTSCSSASGKVKIEAVLNSSNGDVVINGSILRSVSSGSGPACEINGYTISLLDNAVINTSGVEAAGNISLGNVLGLNPTSNIYISNSAQMKANATSPSNGVGGKIDLLAVNSILFLGQIQAQGSKNGGSVNFLCTDGYVGSSGSVDTTVTFGGTNGSFTIFNSGLLIGGAENWGSNYSYPNFTSSNSPSVITLPSVQNFLNTGDFTADATTPGFKPLNLKIVGDIVWNRNTKMNLEALGTIQVDKLVKNTMATIPITSQVINISGSNIEIGSTISQHATGFLISSGSINTSALTSLVLRGGSGANTSAQLTTLNGNQTIQFGDDILIQAGSGANSFAEVKAKEVTVDAFSFGKGLILVNASSCAKAYIDGSEAVAIGKSPSKTKPKNLTIQGGCCSTGSQAYVGNVNSGSKIDIDISNDITLYGGTGAGTNNIGGIVSLLGANKPINIKADNIRLYGGNNDSGLNNQAKISATGSGSSVSIETKQDLQLFGGSGTAASAFISGPDLIIKAGRDFLIYGGPTAMSSAYVEGTNGVSATIGRYLTLQGGSSEGSYADIKVTKGDIKLNASTAEAYFLIRGGNIVGKNNAAARLVVNEGSILIGNESPPNYVSLIGGSGGNDPAAEILVKTNGNIFMETLSDINYLGGVDGTITHAASKILGTGDISHFAGRDMNLATGKNSPSDAYIMANNGLITIDAFRDFNMTGDCFVPNIAYLQAEGPKAGVRLLIGRDLNMTGNARIWVTNPNGRLDLNVGHRITVVDCSVVKLGEKIIYPVQPNPTPGPNPLVPYRYPNVAYYKYTFLYELFYRMLYFKPYDWFLFHSNTFWDSTNYTDPGN
jgi:filamentous hemagglutinin family protein